MNRFYFTDVDDSYADAWGYRSAMGVIAVAVFKEKNSHRIKGEHQGKPARRRASKAKGMESTPGTGFGEQEYSPTRQVHFKPRKQASSRYFIKYEWRNMLCRKDIVSCHHQRQRNRFWPDEWLQAYAPHPPFRDR